jgi:hypothetical protein
MRQVKVKENFRGLMFMVIRYCCYYYGLILRFTEVFE